MSVAGRPRLDVGVVGAGAIGTAVALALAGAGHRIRAVSTADAVHRERVEAALPGVPIVDEAQVIASAQLVVLAIPEADLPGFAAGTARAGVWRPGQLAVHTAPGFGERVLDPLAAIGVIPLAISPAIVATGTGLDAGRLREARFAVSAPPAVLPIAQALVIEMGGDPVVIGDADRPVYAEARAVAAEHADAIVERSAGLLRGIGVDDPAALLRPVLHTSIDAALDRAERAG